MACQLRPDNGTSSRAWRFSLDFDRLESYRATKNSDRRERLEFSGMARKLLSRRSSGFRVARVLCALSAGGRDRLNLLQRSVRERGPPLGRTNAELVSV